MTDPQTHPEDVEELRKLAEKASPGPWSHTMGKIFTETPSVGGCQMVARNFNVADIRGWGHLQYRSDGEAQMDANGDFIAAANPSAILALLDRLEAAETRDAINLNIKQNLADEIKRMSAEIYQLQQAKEAAESECLEQSRLLGISGSREAKLLAQLAASEKRAGELERRVVEVESILDDVEASMAVMPEDARLAIRKIGRFTKALEQIASSKLDWNMCVRVARQAVVPSPTASEASEAKDDEFMGGFVRCSDQEMKPEAGQEWKR